MNSRWLYILLIAALLLPGARARYVNANVILQTGSTNHASTGARTTVAEEEEVLERCSHRSRMKQARQRQAFIQPSLASRAKRSFVAAAQPRSAALASRNGFGGPITC